MKEAAPAATAAALTSSSVAAGRPNRMLSETEHENSVGSCGTSAVAALKALGSICRRSTPSSETDPEVGSYRRSISARAVDFPLPLEPQRAVVLPGRTSRSSPSRARAPGPAS